MGNEHATEVAKIAWRGHVSRLADKPTVRTRRGKYRVRRQLSKVVDGPTPPALWPALPVPLRGRYETSRMPRRRVIIS